MRALGAIAKSQRERKREREKETITEGKNNAYERNYLKNIINYIIMLCDGLAFAGGSGGIAGSVCRLPGSRK